MCDDRGVDAETDVETTAARPRHGGGLDCEVAVGGSGFPLVGVLGALPRLSVSFEWFTREGGSPVLVVSVAGARPPTLAAVFERDRTVREATRVGSAAGRDRYRVRLGTRAGDALECCLNGGLDLESVRSTRRGFVGSLAVAEDGSPTEAVSRIRDRCAGRAVTVGRR